jgi:kynurenine formamidase
MSGTYVDFPGHIAEFDDGLDAGNCPIEHLFMLDTTVIHLRRDAAMREVTADELDAAGIEFKGEVLIVHALGVRSWSDFSEDAIPYFGPSAIRWIVGRRPKIFVSDIYEKRPDQQGIFVELFRNHISCVCLPANLDQLRETYPKSCIVPLKLDKVAQAPCRLVVAEQG